MYVLVLKSEQFDIVLMFSLLRGVRESRIRMFQSTLLLLV
jgi:hypothetical protein